MDPGSNIRRHACLLCGARSLSDPVVAKEMMLGLGHPFTYVTCGRCKCIQLLEVPSDLSIYYPQGYYSMRSRGAIRKLLLRAWAKESFGRPSILGKILVRLMGRHQGVEAINRLAVGYDSRILDVGCGSGDLLFLLNVLGFVDLMGIDPFLVEDQASGSRFRLLRQEISQVQGQFDLVLFNHSLEHVPDPLAALSAALRVLAPDGTLVVRIPVAGSYAWRKYGVNWVGLDPPRHIFLPSVESIHLLCERLSLELFGTKFESDEFMFWGSEQYAANVPLNDRRSYAVKKLWRLFPSKAMLSYRRLAEELNSRGDSDTACFFLRRRK